MAAIRLEIIEGKNVGEKATFEGERLVIGRGTSADLVLSDAAVSRQHAAIEHVGDDFFVVDLNSNNGTFIRGTKDRITRYKLEDGDVINLGSTRIRVLLPRAAVDSEKTMVATRPPEPAAAPAAASRPSSSRCRRWHAATRRGSASSRG